MKLESTLKNMILSLGLIAVVVGALLAVVYSVTSEPIAESARIKTQEAIASVAPKFETVGEQWVGSDAKVVVFPVFNGEELAGAAVQSYSLSGFSGEITVMFGFDVNGEVTGYDVLSHSETPGLGAKMQDWFKSTEGKRSVIGRDASQGPLIVAKDAGGDVDGITAATISSRAFLDALNRAYSVFSEYQSSNK